jgi:hypothetical protein
MTYEVPGFKRSYLVAGDLTASQFKFVKLSGATMVACTATTDKPVGVLQDKPNAAGKAGQVMVFGVTRAVAAGAITAGVPVYITADGSVSNAGTVCVGVAETAASALGDQISVLLKPLGGIS